MGRFNFSFTGSSSFAACLHCFAGIRIAVLLLISLHVPSTRASENTAFPRDACNPKRHADWIASGIALSRDGHTVLIVDKTAHTMDLYRQGKKMKTYLVEIGMETREEGGWRPTPPGKYHLQYKAYTNYYKALLFRMPGYFEIHGKGSGRGRDGQDWTFGCIALSNADMDDLFRRLGIEENGFPVGPKQRLRILERTLLVIAHSGAEAPVCD